MGSLFDWFGSGSSSNSSTQTKINKLEKEIEVIKASISSKVDKIQGKGLSTNDFTNEYKNKIDNIGTTSTPSTPVIINSDSGSYFVTPEMFGAIGDGNTDDTEAIQKAIDSGKSVFFPHGTYLTSEPIIIDNKKFWNLYAQDAIINYTGDNYAFRILNVMQCCIALGYIKSSNGGGVEFYSDSVNSWNQYVALIFNCIGAKTDCIHIETADNGWSNENQVYGGRFLSGNNGVNIISRGINTLNGWKFYNCGIEGVDNGFLFDATEEEDAAICNMVIANCRYGESFKTILKTVGLVVDCLWVASTRILPNFINVSKQTTRFEIIAPIGEWWRLGYNLAWHRGCIIDGKLMAEKTEYETVK